MRIKSEIRIIGFDDCPFEKNQKKKVSIVGVVYRGGKVFEGMLVGKVRVDGLDATQVLIKLIKNTRHRPQLKVVMLDGITMAGFNLVDLEELYEKTELPVIAFSRKRPNLKKIKNALLHFKDFEKRWEIVKKAGKVRECYIRDKKIFYQSRGLKEVEVEEILNLSSTRGYIPEPLRVAHLIAGALVKGESYGKA